MAEGKGMMEHAKDFVQPAIVGAVAYLFTSITDLKHTTDIGGVERKQNTSELLNLWQMKNKEIDEAKAEMKEAYEFRIQMIRENYETRVQQKELEIKLLKDENIRTR